MAVDQWLPRVRDPDVALKHARLIQELLRGLRKEVSQDEFSLSPTFRDIRGNITSLAFDCKQSSILWLSETVASQPTASTKVAAWNAGDAPGPNVVDGAFTTGAVFWGTESVLVYSKALCDSDMSILSAQ